jgi:hypothetical protein
LQILLDRFLDHDFSFIDEQQAVILENLDKVKPEKQLRCIEVSLEQWYIGYCVNEKPEGLGFLI